MRSRWQIRMRQNRARRANELLFWLKERGLTTGVKTFETIIKPFAQVKAHPVFAVWNAWDLLKETQRRAARRGSRWEIISFEPIVIDAEGNAQ